MCYFCSLLLRVKNAIISMIEWVCNMGLKIEGNHDFLDNLDAEGNRELKYYKDIYGNDVRLLTTPEKNFVNRGLLVAVIFIVIIGAGFFYKAYTVQRDIDERTKLYLTSGQSLSDGKDIVNDGGVILSEDSSVVDVEDDGTIVAKASGTTNVTIYKNIDENDFNNKPASSKEKENDGDISIYDAYSELGLEGEMTIEVTVKQAVTGVTLNAPTVNLYVGDTNKLVANVFPFTAYDQNTIWTSSDNVVATVDSNGVVTARNPGVTRITVTTKDGGFKDTTIINVKKKDSSNNIFLSIDSDKMYVGDIKNAVAVVSPDTALGSHVVFSSSDTSVASIDSSGKITARKNGKTTITARVPSENISSEVELTILEKKLERIDLSSTSLYLAVGDKVTLKSYFYPNDASSFINYTSNDSSVASVNSKGEITALKEGSMTIVVKGNNNILAKCEVSVENDIVKAKKLKLKLEKESIDIGEKTKVTYTFEPSDITHDKVTYVSSDSSVATVSNSGVVTGLRAGNAIITATSTNGVNDSVTVKVKDTDIAVTGITTPKNMTLEVGKSENINAVIHPSNADSQDINWTSSDEGVLKVDQHGIITGLKKGKAVVKASIGKISSETAVNVTEIKVEKVALNINEAKLSVGQAINLRSNVLPTIATDTKVNWTSSDDSIVSVSNGGKITALKEGVVTIRATSNSNTSVYDECKVTVSKVPVESFKISHSQVILTKDEKTTIKISSIKPENATYKEIKYSVDNPSIASVSSKGVVTGLKTGKTKLKIKVDDYIEEISLTVLEKGDKVYFIDTYKSASTPSDAILFESNDKYAMIDTGSTISSVDVINFLHDVGVKKLEFILITHFQSESFGGVYGGIESDNILLSDIKVGRLYMKSYSGSDSYFKGVDGNILISPEDITSRRKMRLSMFTSIREDAVTNNVSYVPITTSITNLQLGNFKLYLYNTQDRLKNFSAECLKNHNCNENSNSIVTYATVNGKNMYLAGDIYNANHDKNSKYLKSKTEVEVVKEILKDRKGKIDLYKASNYGSEENNVNDALKNIKPSYSIITNSSNSFNSSNNDAIERIVKYTSNDVMYAGDGSIVVNVNSKGNMNFVQLSE